MPGYLPRTKSSARAHNQLIMKLGLPKNKTKTELSDLAGKFIKDKGLGDETLYSKSRKISTVEERLLATVGTELDPGSSFALRGYKEVRRRATKNFADSVLNNSDAVLKITDPDLVVSIKKGGDGKTLEQLVAEFGPDEGRRLYEQS